jgi:hypothetical protein
MMLPEIEKYEQSKAEDAYEPDPIALDVARREVLKQMVIIVNEVESVRKDPSYAQRAVLENNTKYINPAVFKRRLPVVRPPAPAPPAPPAPTRPAETDRPTDQTEAPPKPEPSPDPKAWMWVKVPGRDSPGNDYYNTGVTDVKKLMLKAYEWEANHPGDIVKCFNSNGWIKSKCGKASEQTEVTYDLYIRIQIDEQWLFVPGLDHAGDDFAVSGVAPAADATKDIDIVDTIKVVSGNKEVVAFNSLGQTKRKVVLPLRTEDKFKGKPQLGIWIRKSTLKLV